MMAVKIRKKPGSRVILNSFVIVRWIQGGIQGPKILSARNIVAVGNLFTLRRSVTSIDFRGLSEASLPIFFVCDLFCNSS